MVRDMVKFGLGLGLRLGLRLGLGVRVRVGVGVRNMVGIGDGGTWRHHCMQGTIGLSK